MERGENRQQPSTRDPGGLRAEHIFLIVAAVSLSAAFAAYVLDSTLPIELNRGAYAIMVALSLMGFCGWLSRSAERRMRRVAVAELQRLRDGQVEVRAALAELRDQMERQRTVYLPAPGRQDGHMSVPPREQILEIVAEEVQKTVQSVRSQAYAEGYVDGVSRRPDDDDDPSPN